MSTQPTTHLANIDIATRIFDGIHAERAVRIAQDTEHTSDDLRTAALALASVEVTDYGTCTGEVLVALADTLAVPGTTIHAAILHTTGNLRDLAWALEDGTINFI